MCLKLGGWVGWFEIAGARVGAEKQASTDVAMIGAIATHDAMVSTRSIMAQARKAAKVWRGQQRRRRAHVDDKRDAPKRIAEQNKRCLVG